MIKNKNELKDYLHSDFSRYPQQRLPFIFRWFVKDEQTQVKHYIWVLRHTEYSININSPFSLLWQLWLRRLSNLYKIYVNINSIGKGLRLVHTGGGIYLNCNVIGNNFTASSGVVIGKKENNENRPVIGNNVNFLIGAKAYGKINIGDNVIVCPNSVVVKSVEENSVVSGVPAKLIKSYENK